MPTMNSGLGGPAGYGENVFSTTTKASGDNDDGSVLVDVTSVFGPGGLTFLGVSYTEIYINSNGAITFGAADDSFSASGLSSLTAPALAPFYSDIDITSGGEIYWDFDTTNGRITITWDNVQPFGGGTANSFQVVITDLGGGDFTVEYIYEDITWTSASGRVAVTGFTDGAGAHTEFDGSGNATELADYETNDFGGGDPVGTYLFASPDGVISGTSGDDTMGVGFTDGDAEVISNGDDSIDGGAGNDLIDAGAGNDTVLGGAGNDTLQTGSDGGAIIWTDVSAGADLQGTTGWDFFRYIGGAGSSAVIRFNSSAGASDADGLADYLHVDTTADAISLTVGDFDIGIDKIVLNEAYSGVSTTVLSSTNTQFTITYVSGNSQVFDIFHTSGSLSAVDAFTTTMPTSGPDGADSLVGGDGADTFVISDSPGNDTIVGGEGGVDDDTLDFSAVTTGIDIVFLSAEAGTATVGSSTLTFSGIEHLVGSDQASVIDASGQTGVVGIDVDAGSGNDTITGSGNADTIDGGLGTDTIDGGGGNDVLDGGGGADSLTGGDGDDLLNYAEGGDTLDGGNGNDTVRGGFAVGVDDALLIGGAGNDIIITYGANDTVFGGSGLDTIAGDSGDEYIDGGSEDDEIFAGSGLDTVFGGSGADRVFGNAGSDLIQGDAGNDTVFGGSGDDTIDGGLNDDVLSGGDGDDSLSGGDGNDLLTSGQGQDTLDGGDGNDTLMNSAGDDSLVGGTGDDLLVASAGNDTLDGGAGFDTLMGGTDNDSLDGGSDADLLLADLAGIRFNESGTDGVGQTGGISDFPNTQLTYELTFASTTTDDNTPLASYVATGEDDEFALLASGGSLVVFVNGASVDTGLATASLFDGNINTLAVTWNSATGALAVYLNGSSAYSGTLATGATLTQGGSFALGQDQDVPGGGYDTSQIFDGTIYGVRLYDDIRTPSELLDSSRGPVADTTDPNLIANWVPDADSNTITDRTGSHTMTLAGDTSAAWSADDDTLVGGDGDDTLFGGGGNDRLSGQGGADRLEGGDGADTFVIEDGFGADTITGGEGGTDDDTLDFSSLTSPITVTFTDVELGTATDGTDTLNFSEIENVTLSDQGDSMDASDMWSGVFGDNPGLGIDGGGGNDTIVASRGGDTVDGGTGDDSLAGDYGDDNLTGGAGDDTFGYVNGDGDDTITDFNFGNSGTLNDGDATNNDFIDLSAFYDNLSELFADFADDGVLNHSNATDSKGRAVDYGDNDDLGSGDSLTFTGASADSSSFTTENTAVVCFASGTQIDTPFGERSIEALRPGDRVTVFDGGSAVVTWVDVRSLTTFDLAADPSLKPIELRAGALDCARALVVSPQHAMLVRLNGQERLVRAKHLADIRLPLVRRMHGCNAITYAHVALEGHGILIANGRPAESFFPGQVALGALSAGARRRFLQACPNAHGWRPARPYARRIEVLRDARRLDAVPRAFAHLV